MPWVCDRRTSTVHPGADTAARPFTVSSGNYSSRFAVTVASAVHTAAVQLAERVRLVAADMLECARRRRGAHSTAPPVSSAVPTGRCRSAGWPAPPTGTRPACPTASTGSPSRPRSRSPAWPHRRADDTVNSSAAYGFLADVAVVVASSSSAASIEARTAA